MVDIPVFQQERAAPTLYALFPATSAGWAGYWNGADGGPTLSLDQAWANRAGVYVFASSPPTDVAGLASVVASLIAQRVAAGVRVLWIVNPSPSPSNWQTQCLLAQCGPSGDWQVTMQAILPAGSYALVVPAGAQLVQSTSGYGIAIAGAATFLTPAGALPVSTAGCSIPLAAPGTGCLSAVLPISAASSEDAFELLGVALRYAYPAKKRRGATEVLPMPILAQNAQSFSLYLSLFPRVTEDSTLTFLAFFPPGSQGSGPTLASF